MPNYVSCIYLFSSTLSFYFLLSLSLQLSFFFIPLTKSRRWINKHFSANMIKILFTFLYLFDVLLKFWWWRRLWKETFNQQQHTFESEKWKRSNATVEINILEKCFIINSSECCRCFVVVVIIISIIYIKYDHCFSLTAEELFIWNFSESQVRKSNPSEASKKTK